MNAHHNQAHRPDRRAKAFSVFWPDSKEGRQVWFFILGFMAFVGALREYAYSTDRYYRFEQHLPELLLAMASYVLGYYFVLVIVRYVMKYFSSPKSNDGGHGKPDEYPLSSEVRYQAGGDQYRVSPAQPLHAVVEVPPVPVQASAGPAEHSLFAAKAASVSVDVQPVSVPEVNKYVAGTLPEVASVSSLDRKKIASVNVAEETTKLSWGSIFPFVIWVCVPLGVFFFVIYSVFDSTGNNVFTGTTSSPIVQTEPGNDRQVANRALVVTIDDQLGDRHPSFFIDVSANSDFRNWFVGSRYRGVENLKLEGLMGASAFFANSAGDTIEISVLQFGTEDLAELVLAAGDRNGIFVDQLLEPRSWADASGRFTREASFAGRSGNAVFLLYHSRTPNLGVVPFDALSKADQAYVNSQILTIPAGPRAK